MLVVDELSDTAFESYDTAPQTNATADRIIIALYRARPGPHDWDSGREGLTQTRPALLPYAEFRRAEDPGGLI